MLKGLLPRLTLSTGAIIRWHIVTHNFRWLTAGLMPGAQVIDVGCGRGEYAIEIARRCAAVRLACGVDEMGRDAGGGFLQVPQRVQARVRLIEGRFSAAIVKPFGTFDAAICVDVLEHVRDDVNFLREVAAAVRPLGRLLLHVPATGQRHPVKRVRNMMARELTSGTGPHVREGYGRDALVKLLESTGWRMETLQPTFGRVAALWTDIDMDLSLLGRITAPLRACCLPFTVIGAVMARYWRPKSGNGWLATAVRVAPSAPNE
jgi:2-polyprenyl-3-methyl-5-hydroxy-6-metoxy-1,4-benzoquinol methylase